VRVIAGYSVYVPNLEVHLLADEAIGCAGWEEGDGNAVTHVQLSLHDLSQLVVLQTQSGKSRGEIVRVLVARGWPEVSAVRFVSTTLSEHRELAARAQVPDEDQQSTNRALYSEQEVRRMLWIVGLVVVIIITYIAVGLLSV
jgi:hypothetical protein